MVTSPDWDNSVGPAATAAKIVEVSILAFNVSVELAATAAGMVEALSCGMKLYGQIGCGHGGCEPKWLVVESGVASPKWPEMPELSESLWYLMLAPNVGGSSWGGRLAGLRIGSCNGDSGLKWPVEFAS